MYAVLYCTCLHWRSCSCNFLNLKIFHEEIIFTFHIMSPSVITQISIATAAFSLLYFKWRKLTAFDTQVQRQSRGAVFLVGNTLEGHRIFWITPLDRAQWSQWPVLSVDFSEEFSSRGRRGSHASICWTCFFFWRAILWTWRTICWTTWSISFGVYSCQVNTQICYQENCLIYIWIQLNMIVLTNLLALRSLQTPLSAHVRSRTRQSMLHLHLYNV